MGCLSLLLSQLIKEKCVSNIFHSLMTFFPVVYSDKKDIFHIIDDIFSCFFFDDDMFLLCYLCQAPDVVLADIPPEYHIQRNQLMLQET